MSDQQSAKHIPMANNTPKGEVIPSRKPLPQRLPHGFETSDLEDINPDNPDGIFPTATSILS